MITIIILWVLFSYLCSFENQNDEILKELRKKKRKANNGNTRTRTALQKDGCLMLQETETFCDDDEEEVIDWGYDKVYDNIYDYLK